MKTLLEIIDLTDEPNIIMDLWKDKEEEEKPPIKVTPVEGESHD